MKVLVADSFPKPELEALARLGVEVDFRPALPAKELPEAVGDASVLVVRGKEVSGEVFERASALSLVIRAGAGVNTIDVQAACRRGVFVANCPGQNAIAVAELTFGLMLALDRKLADNVASLREGVWNKKAFSEARGLFGRTLGVVGFGSIGREVARRAQGFGMRVLAWSRSLDEEKAKRHGVERAAGLLELASQVDVLSLHLPLLPETRGLVSRRVLSAMRTGAMLVNTARAELVDPHALLEEARSGRLSIGLDVWAGEPDSGQAPFASELAALPSVVGTCHIGASTAQAQEAIARQTVRIVEAFLRGGAAPHAVNLARKSLAQARLVVRHYDRVGVLANVLATLKEAGLNVQAVENTVFEGAETACCSLELDARPPQEVLERMRSKKDEVIFLDCFDP